LLNLCYFLLGEWLSPSVMDSIKSKYLKFDKFINFMLS